MTVLLTGCISMPVADIREMNALNIKKLRPGITEQKVLNIMGTRTETVREEIFHEMRLVGYLDFTISNPYKTVSIEMNEDRFLILYYYARVFGMQMGLWDTNYVEKKIPDEFLTPVVLKNGKYMGRGHDFLEELGLTPIPPLQEDDWSMWGS